ncbi:2161_t:CDS:1, partial [Gigaspora margarita]
QTIRLDSNTNTSLSNNFNFNILNKKISVAEEEHNKSIHIVLERYYDLGEALDRLYDDFREKTKNKPESKYKVTQEYKRQLGIDILDMAQRKRKERG